MQFFSFKVDLSENNRKVQNSLFKSIEEYSKYVFLPNKQKNNILVYECM